MSTTQNLNRKPSPLDTLPAHELRDIAAEMLEELVTLYNIHPYIEVGDLLTKIGVKFGKVKGEAIL